MKGVLENSLFETQPHKFEHLNELTRQFATIYCGNSIVKDNIFAVIENYARKKEIPLEILRFPIHDEELWAMTFLKNGTIFVCVNSELALCKQFFAAAHELYHIYCYVEDADQSYIKNGSMLDSDTVNETGKTQEDVEANAFAGLLLMPDQLLSNQINLFGIDKDDMDQTLENFDIVTSTKQDYLETLQKADDEIGKHNSLGEIKSYVLLQLLSLLKGEQVYVFCSDDKAARNGAISFNNVRCISACAML